MKKFFSFFAVIILFCSMVRVAHCQNLTYEQMTDSIPASFTKPTFKGKNAAEFFSIWIHENLAYPKLSLYYGHEGTVIARCIVEIDGSLSNIEIVQSAYPSLDDTVVRLMKRSPKRHWKPALDSLGVPARVRVYMPVVFVIPNR